MISAITQRDSTRLRGFFEEAGYTEGNLRKQLGAPELPSRELRNLPRLLDRTSEPSLLNALLRWFWLGIPQQTASIEPLVPGDFLSMLKASGLLEEAGDSAGAGGDGTAVWRLSGGLRPSSIV